MSYLARLKQKIFQDTQHHGATKATKAPFVPFVAPGGGISKNIFEEQAALEINPLTPTKDTLLDPNLPHRSWRLTFADGTTREQSTLPEARLTEVLALWPTAVAAEPFLGRGDMTSSHSEKIFPIIPSPGATKGSKAPSVPFVASAPGIYGQDLASSEAFQERAGILEFDGGLDRENAEAMAHQIVFCRDCAHHLPTEDSVSGSGFRHAEPSGCALGLISPTSFPRIYEFTGWCARRCEIRLNLAV